MFSKIFNERASKIITLSILFFTIVMEFFIDSLKFPSFIRYINDASIIVLTIISLARIKKLFLDKNNRFFLLGILVYFVACMFSTIVNFVSPMLFLWACRNTFRGIAYMVLVIANLTVDDIKKTMNYLIVFQLVSLLLVLYQFLILKHAQDYIGGIFGYGNGAGVNTFNALLISYFLAAYLDGKESIIKAILVISSSFIIASIAEEKATFIYFFIILIPIIIFSKSSWKNKAKIVSLGVMGLLFGLLLLRFIYPHMFYSLVDIKKMVQYLATTLDGGYELPRIGFFSKINEMLFNNSVSKSIFGIGFGNAETSNYSIFQSAFHDEYGWLHYRWFVGQWLYIEQGYLGFITYIMIFITVIITLIKKIYSTTENNHLKMVGIVMALTNVASIFYNATLKHDMSYLAYFGMAIAFVGLKNSKEESKDDTKENSLHLVG